MEKKNKNKNADNLSWKKREDGTSTLKPYLFCDLPTTILDFLTGADGGGAPG